MYEPYYYHFCIHYYYRYYYFSMNIPMKSPYFVQKKHAANRRGFSLQHIVEARRLPGAFYVGWLDGLLGVAGIIITIVNRDGNGGMGLLLL